MEENIKRKTIKINTTFEHNINAYIVHMPENITFEELSFWSKEFLQSLSKSKSEKCTLLLDTNRHQFESIASLKLLRDILSDEKVKHCISKFAFIQPRQYREPNIISPKEGYFTNFEDAYRWIQDSL